MHYFRKWWEWELGDKIAYLWGAPQDIPNIDSLKYEGHEFFYRPEPLHVCIADGS